MNIMVAILAHARPKELLKCLDSLQKAIDSEPIFSVQCIVIVDPNEAELVSIIHKYSFCDAILEPSLSLSMRRNAARDAARHSQADWLCFIDDDVYVPSSWFVDFLLATKKHPAVDVFSGEVRFLAEEGVSAPSWISLMSHKRKEGPAPSAPTHHAWCSKKVFTQPIDFRPQFDKTGGEDDDYFIRVQEKNHVIFYIPWLYVYEVLPRTRAKYAWFLKRMMRQAATRVHAKRIRKGFAYAMLYAFFACFKHALQSVGYILIPTKRDTAYMHGAQACGLLLGFFGIIPFVNKQKYEG